MSRRSMPRRTLESFLQHRHQNYKTRMLNIRQTLKRQAQRELLRSTQGQVVSNNGASSARSSSPNRPPKMTRNEYEAAMAEIRYHVTEWLSQSGSGATSGAPSNIMQASAEVLNQSLYLVNYVKDMTMLKTKAQFTAATNDWLRHIAAVCSRDQEYVVTVIQDENLPIGAVAGPPTFHDYLTAPNPQITRYHSSEFTKNLKLFIGLYAPKKADLNTVLNNANGECREPMLAR